ncbi:hypothetical protein ACP70R_024360 [Stipagrostis hirtigluma subsp. patula]
MDEKAKMENKLSSAAAFVEGGVQDACDDACSICLDAFCDSNPSTMTSCKHEYHLQCILECVPEKLPVSHVLAAYQHERSYEYCSQELLEAVEQEKNMQANRSRSTSVFRHPALGDFEIPVGADDAELEERIMQHLAVAAAMRRSQRHHRRHHSGPGANNRPHILVLSPDEITRDGSMHTSSGQEEDYEQSPAAVSARPLATLVQQERTARGLEGATNSFLHCSADSTGRSNNRSFESQSTPVDQDSAGPSDLQSFSDTLRSRLQSASMKYKDSITKSTRGWRDKWFSRSNTISVSDIGSEVRREVNAGIAAVSRMMERLETKDGTGTSTTSASGSGSH